MCLIFECNVIFIGILVAISMVLCCLCKCLRCDFIKKNWISLFAIIFSLIALANCYPRTKELGFDYIGVIIGILSFLVAILAIMFGYNILDIRRRIKDETAQGLSGLKSDIKKIQHDIVFLKSKVIVKKIYVKGNIIIATDKFECRDMVAYADISNAINAEIVDSDLIIDDNYKFDPNAIYYASGDIRSYR